MISCSGFAFMLPAKKAAIFLVGDIICTNKQASNFSANCAFRSFTTIRLKAINCIFRTYGGDTVSTWNTEDGMFYCKDCVLQGGVDFYCPRGWALADNCTFICQKSDAAVWHDGSKYEPGKTIFLNCKFWGDDGFRLGRFHRDAPFYLLTCNFAVNTDDTAIIIVPTTNSIFRGRRVYCYNCYKQGVDYSWYKNNLPTDFGINEFNVPCGYDYKWNPINTLNTQPFELEGEQSATNAVANNMLPYQRGNGGWPRHFREQKVDYTRKLSPAELAIVQSGYAEGMDATVDNEATIRAIRYLVKAYQKTQYKKYLAAAEKGIAYLLKAQYKNGGWPQYYPDISSYRSEITYNDNAMINVLNVLDEVAKKKNEFSLVSPKYIQFSSDAVKLGIQCILKTQWLQKGKLTVWCAQYDASTLKPARAIACELPSLSGSESVGIIRFLMSVDNPSKEVIQSVKAGVAWLNKVKINGYQFVEVNAPALPKGKDKVLLPNPGAVTWARFYDLKTSVPFFCVRDGIPKETVAEVEYERRRGYAWYGDRPLKLITIDYPAWKRLWEKGSNKKL